MFNIMSNPFSDQTESDTWRSTRSQLDAYKIRKQLLFSRMKLGTLILLTLITFLSWLVDFIPANDKQFPTTGLRVVSYQYCFLFLKSFRTGRRCELGFYLMTKTLRKTCQDIDECNEYSGVCTGNLHCSNTVGSYVCGCKNGYRTVGTDCIDIDECIRPDQCPETAICQNTEGNFTCKCFSGFGGDHCTDIDECTVGTADCDTNADCINSD